MTFSNLIRSHVRICHALTEAATPMWFRWYLQEWSPALLNRCAMCMLCERMCIACSTGTVYCSIEVKKSSKNGNMCILLKESLKKSSEISRGPQLNQKQRMEHCSHWVSPVDCCFLKPECCAGLSCWLWLHGTTSPRYITCWVFVTRIASFVWNSPFSPIPQYPSTSYRYSLFCPKYLCWVYLAGSSYYLTSHSNPKTAGQAGFSSSQVLWRAGKRMK